MFPHGEVSAPAYIAADCLVGQLQGYRRAWAAWLAREEVDCHAENLVWIRGLIVFVPLLGNVCAQKGIGVSSFPSRHAVDLMTKRNLLIGGRLFFGAFTLFAVGVQLVRSISLKFSVVSYFSYFTNLSNIFASVVFIIGAVYLIQRRTPSARDEVIRGASVVAMAVVGIVFSLLLRNEDLGGLLAWVNFVVHFLMPIAVVADWLIQPPKTAMGTPQVATWLVYPLVYLVYTLARGPVAKFYPYPFLNPANGGYGTVALYSVAIFVIFLLFGGLLAFLGNRLPRAVAEG